MNAKWVWVATLLGVPLALLLVGCKSSQPDLKPAKEPEKFTSPPYSLNNNYPKQALTFDDQSSKGLDPGGAMPGMRGMGGPSMGGAGGGAAPASFGGPGGPR